MPGWVARHFARPRKRKIGVGDQDALFITKQSRNDFSTRVNDGCAAIVIKLVKWLVWLGHVPFHSEAS